MHNTLDGFGFLCTAGFSFSYLFPSSHVHRRHRLIRKGFFALFSYLVSFGCMWQCGIFEDTNTNTNTNTRNTHILSRI